MIGHSTSPDGHQSRRSMGARASGDFALRGQMVNSMTVQSDFTLTLHKIVGFITTVFLVILSFALFGLEAALITSVLILTAYSLIATYFLDSIGELFGYGGWNSGHPPIPPSPSTRPLTSTPRQSPTPTRASEKLRGVYSSPPSQKGALITSNQDPHLLMGSGGAGVSGMVEMAMPFGRPQGESRVDANRAAGNNQELSQSFVVVPPPLSQQIPANPGPGANLNRGEEAQMELSQNETTVIVSRSDATPPPGKPT